MPGRRAAQGGLHPGGGARTWTGEQIVELTTGLGNFRPAASTS